MSKLFLVALVGALCVCVTSKSVTPSPFNIPAEPEWLEREPGQEAVEADIEDNETGKTIHLRVPFYNDERMTRARVEYDRQTFKDVIELIELLSKEILLENKSVIAFGIKRGPHLFSMITKKRREYREFEALDPSPKIKRDYTTAMGQIVRNIAQSHSSEPKTGENAHKISLNVVAALKEILNVSPVGLFVDWNGMTLDGVSLVDYLAPVIEGFRKTGRSGMLGVLDMVGKSLQKLA